MAGRVTAWVDAARDPTLDAFDRPSQLLNLKVLRRPLEPEQYLSIRYTERLAEAGIEPSVGTVGDSYDNALAETINGLYKTEVIRRNGPWRNIEEVEFATLVWVDWFNNRRLFGPIGNIPPIEFEALYYKRQETPAMVVGLT
jgi:transposase InsO family protein